jgi:diketogulonate reductase-like aldo/keto reductase
MIEGRGSPTHPTLLYGTAWKEEATEGLVTQALAAGFRGIDTANQRKHYFEAGVGAALQAALTSGRVQREGLFVQTKFTFERGQDQRLPYDPKADIGTQVRQSFESSQEHLGLRFIDSLVLHGPTLATGLHPNDHEAWRAMEELVGQGLVGSLGISNVSAAQVAELVKFARVAPRFVQNRCYASRRWDGDVRAQCKRHGIVYQGFSLLTANGPVLARPELKTIAARHGVTPAQLVFRFALHVGMLPLTGTSDPRHMTEDLRAADISLTAEDFARIERG